MKFRKVVYNKELGDVTARVNRETGELQLNPAIWDRLPREYRQYVLYHEEGHLVLQTADEFRANEYAMRNFVKAGEITDEAIGRKIIVMSEILGRTGSSFFKRQDDDPDRNAATSDSGVDPVTAVANAIGSVFQSLPVLGIGSKARQTEAEQAAELQMEINANKSQATIKIIIIGGLFLITAVIVFMIFKK